MVISEKGAEVIYSWDKRIIPFDCGSRIKISEKENELDFDDNCCLILSLMMYDPVKFKGLTRAKFFQMIIDYLADIDLSEQILSSVLEAIQESKKPNTQIDAILLHVWALIVGKDILLCTEKGTQYYFANLDTSEDDEEDSDKINTDDIYIFLDLETKHYVPLFYYNMVTSTRMEWYAEVKKYNEYVNKEMERINKMAVEQLQFEQLKLLHQAQELKNSINNNDDLILSKLLENEDLTPNEQPDHNDDLILAQLLQEEENSQSKEKEEEANDLLLAKLLQEEEHSPHNQYPHHSNIVHHNDVMSPGEIRDYMNLNYLKDDKFESIEQWESDMFNVHDMKQGPKEKKEEKKNVYDLVCDQIHSDSDNDKSPNDGIVFEPHFDEKYGGFDPNRMDHQQIEDLNMITALDESLNENMIERSIRASMQNSNELQALL
jgi:hypothetical protein